LSCPSNSREVLALRPDGSTVPIRIAIGRVPLDGAPVFVGFISDLTQRRAMEQELQASEQRLRSLMANIPGVTFRCRHDADCCSSTFVELHLRNSTMTTTRPPGA
jgi:PAS domain-containing protein